MTTVIFDPDRGCCRWSLAVDGSYHGVADHRGLLGWFVPGRARWADRVIAAHGGPPTPQ